MFYVGLVALLPLIFFLFARLDALHGDLNRLSSTDSLTGLANRRAFMERLHAEVRRQARTRRPLSLVLVDADHFKRVNDQHGHPVGDQVLATLASLLSLGVRSPTDLVARLGGEEFALLLPDTTLDEVEAVCWRLQKRLNAERFLDASGRPFKVTVSMGAVEGLAQPAEALLRQADSNLYRAKEGGRDRVVYSVLGPTLAEALA